MISVEFDELQNKAKTEPEAAYELACAYRDGEGIEADHEQFLEWLNKATDLGSPRAMYDTAIRYKEGDGVSTDEKSFFELMKKAAEKAYDDAMLELAFAYREGMGTAKRLRSYFMWLTKAAEAGNKEAMFHLAFAYKNREGIPRRNIREFFRWLREAAKREPAKEEQPDALFHLAIAHLEGEGTKKSRVSYSRWMKKAAEAGIPAGMYHLAMFHLEKAKPDRQEFSKWIKSSLKAGYDRAFIASGLDDLSKELRVSHKDLMALHKDLNNLYETVMKIKRTHIVEKKKAREGVAHFTRFETLDSILPVDISPEKATTRLRLYNFAYMNDPQEGKRLLDENILKENLLREFFSGEDNLDNPLWWEEHESSVYIGSFTLRGDELDMWRTTYGNNGRGYCIVTPLEAFNQEEMNASEAHGGEGINVTAGSFKATAFLSTTLYAVRYEERDVKNTLNKLKPNLDKIKKGKSKLRGDTKALDRTVRLIVSHILYLYKNEHYQSEEEARMISPFDISFEGLKLDSREKPSRIYVESLDFLLSKGSRIVIGPTVPQPQQTVAELDLKYRLALHHLDGIKVSRSELTNLYR